MPHRHATVLLIALALGVAACGGSGEDNGAEAEPMTFNVDPAQLGEAVSDTSLGLVYRPPRGWAPLEPAAMERIRAAVVRDTNATGLPLVPEAVYADSVSRSLFSVASMEGATPLDSLRTTYHEVLTAAMPDSMVRETTFQKDGLRVLQFLVERPDLVNFKLVLESPTNRAVQFDYLIPRQVYPQAVRAIESSIGSIRPLED